MKKIKKALALAAFLVSILKGTQAGAEEETARPLKRQEEVQRMPLVTPTDFGEKPLAQILAALESSFAEGYLKIEQEGRKSVHSRGRVHLRLEKNFLGEELPVIYLTDKAQIMERLAFSQIEYLNPLMVRGKEGVKYHLLVTYATLVTNADGLQGKKMDYYDLLVKDDPLVEDDSGLVGGYFLELRERFSTKELPSLNLNPAGLDEALRKSLVYPPISVPPGQLDEICQGISDNLPEDYELKPLGQVNFEECVYEPEKSLSGLEEMVREINSALSQDPARGILFLCGNASRLSAKECPLPAEEGNFLLSFCRAKETSLYLMGRVKTAGEITILPYVMGTQLDERSARAYYVTFKQEEAKK